jgi:3-oxoacyl-[acyl-carrier protein] reductase
VVVSGDMADPDVPRRIVAETAERLAPVDILVANAGTGVRADLDDVDVAAWDYVMAVNLRAPFLLAQAVAPHMREQRYGRIVLLSSVAAFLGGILSPQYTASKAGLIGLAHSLAATLAPHGITVNAIAPGLIMTDMLAGDPRLETLERSVPVGRLGQPAEVADVIVSVARNAYMTGQTVSVDGGRYPR